MSKYVLLIWTSEMISRRSLLQLSLAISSSDSFFTQCNVIAKPSFHSFWLLFLHTLLGCRLIDIRGFNYIFNLKVYFICLGGKESVCTCMCMCVCIHVLFLPVQCDFICTNLICDQQWEFGKLKFIYLINFGSKKQSKPKHLYSKPFYPLHHKNYNI